MWNWNKYECLVDIPYYFINHHKSTLVVLSIICLVKLELADTLFELLLTYGPRKESLE